MEIKKVAVLGAGVMGSGIAAHIANAGHEVYLMDIVPKDADDRSVIARSAIQKMMKANPAPFMHKRNARLVTPGNIEDDLDKLSECDWIIEAVIENIDIKRDLYKKVDAKRKKGSVVSSNTSTIPLNMLIEGQSDAFAKDFLITHFFNPPRYMRLLELVVGEHTRKDAAEAIEKFCDVQLGKGVVHCHDTPSFIGNRIGIFWLQCALNEALDLGISVEEADLVCGRPMGIPKTGVFGLMDLVGIDLMPHLAESMNSTLPESDAYRQIYRDVPLVDKMIKDGYTGRKGKGGFYRLNTEGGKRVKEALNLQTGEYATAAKARLDSVDAAKKGGLRALVEHNDIGGKYAWAVLSQVLSYAASLVPEIADNIFAVDQGMKLGYAWKYGPFEMIDQLGTDWFANKLTEAGMDVPELLKTADGKPFYKVENGVPHYMGTDGKYKAIERPEGVVLLSDIKLASEPVKKNASASLWDIGDGVLCLEFHSKMNSIDDQIMAMIHKAIDLIGDGTGDWKALVIHNEGTNFSVGANLGLAMFAINVGLWPQIDEMVEGGQKTYMRLKHAPFPVVGAPSGMALGGGCEVLLHCDAVQAHAETYIGLVEVGVGVIPAWGGCKEMLLRHHANSKKIGGGPMPPVSKAFEKIGTATVAKSAEEAKSLLYFKDTDDVTMNRDRLLADAKAKALELARDYTAPEKTEIRLPGPSGKCALDMAVEGLAKSGKATPHDVTVSDHLATVLTGGPKADWTEPMSDDDILKLEYEHFIALIKTDPTLDRIEHMLEKGKPLRN